MKLLLYCTKSKPYLIHENGDYDCNDMSCSYNCYSLVDRQYFYDEDLSLEEALNGKVVAECDYEVEEITPSNLVDFEIECCVDRVSMFKYFKPNLIWDNKFEILLNTFGNSILGYAIHIKNLKVFNKPKELSDYYFIHNIGGMLLTDKLKKAPQNMQRVSIQEWEYGSMSYNDIAILISIQPQWLCKILNGEKTVEIRKKILKRMN